MTNTIPTNCSCLICRNIFSARGLRTHYERIHLGAQTNYTGKTEKAQLASQTKAKKIRDVKELAYALNPKLCCGCQSIIPINKQSNKFCNKSCGAKFSNANKDWTTIKTGPAKGIKTGPRRISEMHNPFIKISQCEICNKFHPRTGRTCSDLCYAKFKSIQMTQLIHDGYNPNLNRGRRTQSYMELSFTTWLKLNFTQVIVHTEHKFKRHDIVKTYFADFYIPELKLIIELDGSQHQKTKEYDQDRDQYIKDNYMVNIIRISHTEYQDQSRLQEIKDLLNAI